MPTVRAYGVTKVDQAALPGARLQATETPLSEGAGLAEAQGQRDEAIASSIGQPLARFGAGVYAKMQEEERTAADQAAIREASNQLSAWKNSALYDPQSGAFTKRGKDALSLPNEIQASFGDATAAIEGGLSNDRQREEFAKLKSSEWQGIDLQVQRHVFGEAQAYRKGTLEGVVSNGVDEAIRSFADPQLIDTALGRVVGAIREGGPGLGLAPEQIEAQVRATTSDVHVGVIKNLLGTEQDGKASIYFEQHKGAIAATQLDDVQKALEVGTVRRQSQTISDQILQQGGSLTEQLDRMRKLELDPKVRDAVEQRLEHADTVDERAKREAAEGTMRQAYDILDRTPDVTKIPPDRWASFSGPVRSAMIEYAKHKLEGTPVKTDPPTWYRLMNQAGDDPETFAKANLLNYKARLDEADFKQLGEIQKAIKNGDRAKADASLANFNTHEQIFDATLRSYGISTEKDRTTQQQNAVAELRRMLDTRVQAQSALQVAAGKKPAVENVDVQHMLDALLSTQVDQPRSWWAIWRPATQKKNLVDLTIDDVPATDKAQIIDALKQLSRPVSDPNILTYYLERLARAPQK